MRVTLLYISLITSLLSFSQKTTEEWIETHKENAENATSDTAKVSHLLKLSIAYRRVNMDEAVKTSNQALVTAVNTGNSFYVANALNTVSYTNMMLGELDLAESQIKRSILILGADTVAFDKNTYILNHTLSKQYNTLGSIYDYKGEHNKAIKCFLSALDICESENDVNGLASTNNNLGITYFYLHDLPKAEEYFIYSFEYYISMEDSANAYQTLMNVGVARSGQGKEQEALSIYWQVYREMEKIGNLRDMGHAITNIGDVHKNNGDLDSALICVQMGVEIDEQLGDKEGLATNLRILGNTYLLKGDFSKARKNMQKSLDIAIEMQSNMVLMYSYLALQKLEAEAGNFKRSLEYQKMYTAYEDSIQEESNSRAIGKIEAENEFNKELAVQKAEDEQKIKIAEEKRKKETTQLYFIVGILAVVILFILVILRNLRETKKQKELVNSTKQEIEQKNNELTDSIRYAQRIQDALLKGKVEQNVPEHFICFQPKDIVSGDFYWTYTSSDYWYIAAADCTGHGVPGAMLTMLGTAYLNEICAGGATPSPAELLDELKSKITSELSQTGEAGESKDGMDISLLRIHLKSGAIEWAGANNGLYHVQEGELSETKPNKQPIGFSDKVTPFTNHTLSAKAGDYLYLFSDGFADQFGGERGKKYKYANFKKLLLSLHEKTTKEQQNLLHQELTDWKGELDQLDDICIIGIQL